VFEFRNGDVGASEASKHIAEAFSALKSVGVDISADDEVVAKAAELDAETVKTGPPRELEERISALDDVAFFTKSKMYELAQMALMSDRQFEKFILTYKELRALVTKALVKRPVKG